MLFIHVHKPFLSNTLFSIQQIWNPFKVNYRPGLMLFMGQGTYSQSNKASTDFSDYNLVVLWIEWTDSFIFETIDFDVLFQALF